ncbi:MAG: UDP-N-acetylmuramate--L-alanine ligase [Deltaproteobacteria bacterium]|nr:UDP-N-acetylmuramate--L-alanine ligase [Deltaproteobacteria bacterium]
MLKKVHFVGIGGIGMSGIAEVLISLGIKVQGSDLVRSDNMVRLENLGAQIFYGHEASQVEGADIVVTSSSIASNNPEVVEASKRSVPTIPRARMLAELMRLQQGIAIAGSHGKTTTTTLVAAILERAGLDPTVVIGGKANHLGSNARHGKGKFLVAEADESDGSFKYLLPNIAVVTNLDLEHLDYWKGGLPELQEAFVAFLNKLPFFGLAVLCKDNAAVRELLPRMERRVVTYGIFEPSDFQAKDIIHERHFTSFKLVKSDQDLGLVKLKLLGEHNVQNALAAIAVGDELGISLDAIKSALEDFAGVQRRFTQVGEKNGVIVVDDYGHHPTEIKAVLKTAKKTFADRRIVALFEPHRYSRTRDLMSEFVTAFKDADCVVISDIYPAHEEPVEGVSSRVLVEGIQQTGHPSVFEGGELASATARVLELSKSGDVIITLGAGAVTKASLKILESLEGV